MKTLSRFTAMLALIALLTSPLAIRAEEQCAPTVATILGSSINGTLLSLAIQNPTPDPLPVSIVGTLHKSGKVVEFVSQVTVPPGITIYDLDFEEPISVIVSLELFAAPCDPCAGTDCAPTEGPDPIGRPERPAMPN